MPKVLAPCLGKRKKTQTKTNVKMGLPNKEPQLLTFLHGTIVSCLGKWKKNEEKQKPISTLPNKFEVTCKY